MADKRTRTEHKSPQDGQHKDPVVEVVEGEPVDAGAGPDTSSAAGREAPEVVEGEIVSESASEASPPSQPRRSTEAHERPEAEAEVVEGEVVEIGEAQPGEVLDEAVSPRSQPRPGAEAGVLFDELNDLREQLASAQAQVDEYLDDLRRERAAFQNYKRRQESERAELRQRASAGILTQLLPVLDDLERALDAIPEEQADQPWVQGIRLIQRKLNTILDSVGVVEAEAGPGQAFDPFVHEAVTYEEHEDFQEGEIIAVVQKGYVMNGRTLRPARVRVAR